MKKLLTGVALVCLGVLAGSALFGAGAQAQAQAPRAGQYAECIGVTLWEMRGKDLNAGEAPSKTVKVPAGWTVVGGSASGNQASILPSMIICR
ncbi:MAG: hypothetical protein HY901_29525 [Deltaproteobacteria bacterium]|nr:hypothetical protein [Deltaproteobacteria bacterium]